LSWPKRCLEPQDSSPWCPKPKVDALEGRKATKNPTARLIWRIMEAVSEKVKLTGTTGLETGTELRKLISKRTP